jgi:hypothetical protein
LFGGVLKMREVGIERAPERHIEIHQDRLLGRKKKKSSGSCKLNYS